MIVSRIAVFPVYKWTWPTSFTRFSSLSIWPKLEVIVILRFKLNIYNSHLELWKTKEDED